MQPTVGASAVNSSQVEYDLQAHYIGGDVRSKPLGRDLRVLNPATNEVLALAAAGGATEVDAAVAAARRAFDDGPWPRLKVQQRAEILRRDRRAESARMPTSSSQGDG